VSRIETNTATGRGLSAALTVLACAQLITALDFNIVYVALPEIGAQLGFSSQFLQWVFSAYSIMFGGFLLLGGRAADRFGRRRMFILGLALYAMSSLLGGLAHSPIAIIAARAIQGLGGALLFPATVSLINTLFEEGPKRNRALGIWSLAGSAGLTLGSIVGGILVGSLGWPFVFFVNVPIALAVGLGALKAIPRDSPIFRREGFDLLGAVTSTGGVTSLVLLLVQAPQWGWTSRPVVLGAAAVVVLLGLFVLIESRSANPIMPLRLLTNGGLAVAMALTFLFMGTFMALPYFSTELFQRVYRFSPLMTGFAFLVPCFAIAVGTQIGGRLAARFGVRPLLLLGLTVGAIGATLVAVNITPGGSYGHLVPGLLIFGLGQGTAWTPMWIAASAGIAESEQGIASGMASTTLWVGGATGLAILVIIANLSTNSSVTDPTVVLVLSIRSAIFAIAAGIAASLPIAFFAGNTTVSGPQFTTHAATTPRPRNNKEKS
jgi:EmrB/QacA subfamily drug resistance transporter